MAIPTETLIPAQIISFLKADNAILRLKTFRDVIAGHTWRRLSLALGDGVARVIIGRQLEQGEKEWLAQAPEGGEEWNELKWNGMRCERWSRGARKEHRKRPQRPTGCPTARCTISL